MYPKPLSLSGLYDLWTPGAILHVRHRSNVNMISWALSKWQKRLEQENDIPISNEKIGSHDAICCYSIDGNLLCGVGEMGFSGGRWVRLDEYYKKMKDGLIDCWYLFPIECSNPMVAEAASMSFILNSLGKPYDYYAYARLLVKSLLFDLSDSKNKFLKKIGDKVAGKEWAHWCTESVSECWKKAGLDVYLKPNPTPLTTAHRAGFVWGNGPITLRVLQ